MGEIKFRAWDKIQKLMSEPFDFKEIAALYDRGYFCGSLTFQTMNLEKIDFVYDKEVVIMQYTGLKDKNGKEIYEGDIVKHDWFRNGEPFLVENLPFFFYEIIEYGVFEGENEKPHYFEIIGNVYENSSLLNK